MSHPKRKIEIQRPQVSAWGFFFDYDSTMYRYIGLPRLATELIKGLRKAIATNPQVTYTYVLYDGEFRITRYMTEFLKYREEVKRYSWQELKRNFAGEPFMIDFIPVRMPIGSWNRYVAVTVSMNPVVPRSASRSDFRPDTTTVSTVEMQAARECFIGKIPEIARVLTDNRGKKYTHLRYLHDKEYEDRLRSTYDYDTLDLHSRIRQVLTSNYETSDYQLMLAHFIYRDELTARLWHEVDSLLGGDVSFKIMDSSLDYVDRKVSRAKPLNAEYSPGYSSETRIRKLSLYLTTA